jgi:hypothetical protein
MNKTVFLTITILVVLMVGFFLINNYIYDEEQAEDLDPQITSYEECVEAGHPVMDSYPEQCETPDGQSFAAFEIPGSWELRVVEGENALFMHPPDLGLEYIEATDWPPQVQVLDDSFACTEAGEPGARAGRTERRTIAGRDYCITTVVEGAAGSIFTQYAYATALDGQDSKTAIFTFSFRASQCGNFATDAEREQCESEQDFDIDALIHQIFKTFRYQK